jgi:hypothetical protein
MSDCDHRNWSRMGMLLRDAALAITTRPRQFLFRLLNGRLQEVAKGRAALISRELGELLGVPANERNNLLSV